MSMEIFTALLTTALQLLSPENFNVLSTSNVITLSFVGETTSSDIHVVVVKRFITNAFTHIHTKAISAM